MLEADPPRGGSELGRCIDSEAVSRTIVKGNHTRKTYIAGDRLVLFLPLIQSKQEKRYQQGGRNDRAEPYDAGSQQTIVEKLWQGSDINLGARSCNDPHVGVNA